MSANNYYPVSSPIELSGVSAQFYFSIPTINNFKWNFDINSSGNLILQDNIVNALRFGASPGDAVNNFRRINMNSNGISAISFNGVTMEAHAIRHFLGGADGLTAGNTTISVETTGGGTFGSSTVASKMNHIHNHGTQGASGTISYDVSGVPVQGLLHTIVTTNRNGFYDASSGFTAIEGATTGPVLGTLSLRNNTGDLNTGMLGLASFTGPGFNIAGFADLICPAGVSSSYGLVFPGYSDIPTSPAFKYLSLTGITTISGLTSGILGWMSIPNIGDILTTENDILYKNPSLSLDRFGGFKDNGQYQNGRYLRMFNPSTTGGSTIQLNWARRNIPVKEFQIYEDCMGITAPYLRNFVFYRNAAFSGTLTAKGYDNRGSSGNGIGSSNTSNTARVIWFTEGNSGSFSSCFSGLSDVTLGTTFGYGLSLETSDFARFETAITRAGASFSLGTGSSDLIRVKAGFLDNVTGITPFNGAWFEFDETVGNNWQVKIAYNDWQFGTGYTLATIATSQLGPGVSVSLASLLSNNPFAHLQINWYNANQCSFLIYGVTVYSQSSTAGSTPPACPTGNALAPVVTMEKLSGSVLVSIEAQYIQAITHSASRNFDFS